jgi:hypothetical protein
MTNQPSQECQTGWQSDFVAMLPEIEHRLRRAFRDLTAEAREDSTEDGIIHCLLTYLRLFEQGRVASVKPASLAWYAVLQVRKGRQAGCRMNSKEPLSRYAQLRNGITVVRLHGCDPSDQTWINDIIDSRRMSIADQVAARLDITAWIGSLCRRTRNIATDLAKGFSTSEVARKYRLSAGRIAQVRRELKSSWQQFQGESFEAAH